MKEGLAQLVPFFRLPLLFSCNDKERTLNVPRQRMLLPVKLKLP